MSMRSGTCLPQKGWVQGWVQEKRVQAPSYLEDKTSKIVDMLVRFTTCRTDSVRIVADAYQR